MYKALKRAEELIDKGEREVPIIKAEMMKVLDHPLLKIDYVEIVNEATLEPIERIDGKVLIALAVFVGKARLIDNTIIEVPRS